MKKTLVGLFTFLLVAQTSQYILPYPSFMPGNKLYNVKEVWDKFKGLFMFGNFTKFSYELALSDKYLVEAKTLYEYGQKDLGEVALNNYYRHVTQLPGLLKAAQNEGKNISVKENLYKSALKKHQEIIRQMP